MYKIITIIIPHYESPLGLQRLLASIPQHDNYQVIVVDDHSSVDVSEIVSLHNSAQLVKQEPGLKYAGAARNTALDLAVGEYILFADSDDYFVDDAFSILSNYFEKHYDVVYFSPVSINETGASSFRHVKYESLVKDFMDNGKENIRFEYFVPWSKLVKRSVIESNGIRFDEVIASNDVMASLKIGYYAKNYHVTDEVIYCVVESSDSLTKQLSEKVVDSRFDVLCRYNNFVRHHISDKSQISVASCLSRALNIGFYKFLSVLFIALNNKYPIFPDKNGWSRWFQRKTK